MIALFVFMMVMGLLFSFYNYAYNTYSYDFGRTMVNRDFRRVVNEMTKSVTYANAVFVYSEFNDRTIYTDSNGNQTGNFVLCVTTKLQSDGTNHIVKLEGYYRGTGGSSANTGAQHPIRSFSMTLDSSATDPLTLIPNASTINTHPIKCEDCVGLHPGAKVFRNFLNNVNSSGVLFYAQIQYQGRAFGRMNRGAANTLCFTIVRRS